MGKAAIPTLQSFFLPCGKLKGSDGGELKATVVNKANGVLRPVRRLAGAAALPVSRRGGG